MDQNKLLERQVELERMQAALEAASSGDGLVLLVGGEAGIGKSSLIEHFAASQKSKARVLTGYCDSLLTPSPLAPLHDIARQLHSDSALELDRQDRTTLIFARLLNALSESKSPSILVIEDIHWADEATLDLIKYLSRRLDLAHVLLIASFRDDEVQRHHGLRLLLGELARSQSVQRLNLGRLSRQAVATLAQDRVRDVDGLYRQTAGNPFFVTEAISNPGEDIPITVRDAVLGRAALLGPAGRATLDLAAVIGVRIEYALLEALGEDATTGLSECLAVGLLVEVIDGVAFRHDLARSAVLEAIDPLRRRSFYRRILSAASGERLKQDLARLAHYAEGAASAENVVRYGSAAGKRAADMGSHREAAAHFESVLRFSGSWPVQERAMHLVWFARECGIIDRLAEATEAYRQAAALFAAAGDQLRHGDTLASLAWPLVRNGENGPAQAAIEQAISLLQPLGPTRELANAYRTQAHLAMLDRDRNRAVEVGGRAIALASSLGDIPTLASAELVVGAAKLVCDEDEGRLHLDRCLDLAEAHGLDDLIALARLNIGSSYGEQYHFAKAEAELSEGIAYTRSHDLDHSGHYMRAWLALTRFHQGRWGEAAEMATELLMESNLSAISRIMVLVALGRVRVRRGDPGATQILDEALALARRTRTLQRLAPVHAARAEMAWAAGDGRTTLEEANAVFDLAVERKHPWHTGEFLYWRRVGGQDVPLCEWTARPYSLQLSGHWQEAAEAWRERGCPFEEARALAEGKETAQIRALETFDRLGAAPAAAALRRKMRMAGTHGVPRGPRASTRNNSFGLTQREVTTLGYLVRGYSNTEIAATLFISAKTVDHHVSSILAKLGVASRRQASTLALKEKIIPQNGEGDGLN